MFDIFDLQKYKSCQLKTYDVHICMPPKGTIVYNMCDGYSLRKFPRVCGKFYLTLDDQRRNPSLASVLGSISSVCVVSEERPFVVACTCGELYTIGANELAYKFTFLQNNQPVSINQSSLNHRLKNGVLPWTVARLSYRAKNDKYIALHVPSKVKFTDVVLGNRVWDINTSGRSRTSGSFVVVPVVGGTPNFACAEVMSSEVFLSRFNNVSWVSEVKTCTPYRSVTIDDLPNLCIDVGYSSDMVNVFFDGISERFVGNRIKEGSTISCSCYFRGTDDDITVDDGNLSKYMRGQMNSAFSKDGIYFYDCKCAFEQYDVIYRGVSDDKFYRDVIRKLRPYKDVLYFTIDNGLSKGSIHYGECIAYYTYTFVGSDGVSCTCVAKFLVGKYGSTNKEFIFLRSDSDMSFRTLYGLEIKAMHRVNSELLSSKEMVFERYKACASFRIVDILSSRVKESDLSSISSVSKDFIESDAYNDCMFLSSKEVALLGIESNYEFVQNDFLISGYIFNRILVNCFVNDLGFFGMHPIKSYAFECYHDLFRIQLLLMDGYCLEVYKDNNENGSLSLRYLKEGQTEYKEFFKISDAMISECYSCIDSDRYFIEAQRSCSKDIVRSEELWGRLSKTELYKRLEICIDKFLTSRKPSLYGFSVMFKDFCRGFSDRLSVYGLNVVSPFKFDDKSYDDIIIDGDNDNQLRLHFKLVVDTDKVGINISGRTGNKVLSYTHTIFDSSDGSSHSRDDVVKTMIEDDVCEYLGVSKWKRFFTDKYINFCMPFSADIRRGSESKRNVKSVIFDVRKYNARVKCSWDLTTATVVVKFSDGTPQVTHTFSGKITSDTQREVDKVLFTLVTSSVSYDDGCRALLNAIYDYTPKNSFYTTGYLLRYIIGFELNTIKFVGCSGGDLICTLLQDGTVESKGYIGENFERLPLAEFPVVIEVHHNMSHYYRVH